mgnify:CR=1 FL=1
MEVEVRCYGDVREAVGERAIRLELEPGATTADLLDAMASATAYVPFDVPKGRHLAVMRERRHLDAADALADGDVVGISESPMPE